MLGVNICLIFFGWFLLIASALLVYGTFKRQSKLLLPYIFALFETVLLVILLEVLPEFIDNLGVGWFLLLNFMIGKQQHVVWREGHSRFEMWKYLNDRLYGTMTINHSSPFYSHHCLRLDRRLLALLWIQRRRTESSKLLLISCILFVATSAFLYIAQWWQFVAKLLSGWIKHNFNWHHMTCINGLQVLQAIDTRICT